MKIIIPVIISISAICVLMDTKKISSSMRKLFNALVLIFFLNCLLSCAGAKSDSVDDLLPSDPVVNSSIYIGTTNNKIAYVLSIESGEASVYIPSVDRYGIINLSTGQFITRSAFLYSGVGCTGTARVNYGFFGEVGKSVIYDGVSYYRVLAQDPGSFSHQSASYDGEACFSYVGTAAKSYTYEVVSVPYNFSAIAPLSVKYQ